MRGNCPPHTSISTHGRVTIRQMSVAGSPNLKQLANLPELRSLNLRDVRTTAEYLKALADYKQLTSVNIDTFALPICSVSR
jgi:hypothetical protein